jgi:hypothetical protein
MNPSHCRLLFHDGQLHYIIYTVDRAVRLHSLAFVQLPFCFVSSRAFFTILVNQAVRLIVTITVWLQAH